MRRFLLALIVMAGMVGAPAWAAESSAVKEADKTEKLEFGFLEKWYGKDPGGASFQRFPGDELYPPLWADPKVKETLVKTLGLERTELLISGWMPKATKYYMTLIGRSDDRLFFISCAANGGDCGTHQATIYIDMQDGKTYACWESEEGDEWLSPSTPAKKLPKDYCNSDDYDEQHNVGSIYREQQQMTHKAD